VLHWVGTFFLLEKDFFWKARSMHNIYFVWRSFFGKPGSRVMPQSFFFKKNKQQLTCGAGWGPLFLLEFFFWKAGMRCWIFFVRKRFFLESRMHNFYFVWRRIFWKAWSRVMRQFFFTKKAAVCAVAVVALCRVGTFLFIFFSKPVPRCIFFFGLKKNFSESQGLFSFKKIWSN